MKYVKIPLSDMSLITCVADVFESICPQQYKKQAEEVCEMLHKGKFEIVSE